MLCILCCFVVIHAITIAIAITDMLCIHAPPILISTDGSFSSRLDVIYFDSQT